MHTVFSKAIECIDWFVPPRMRGQDLDLLRRARLVVLFCWALAMWVPFYYVMFDWIAGYPEPAHALALAGLTSLLIPFALRLTGSIAITGNALVAVLYLALLSTALLLGGFDSPPMLWYAGVPIVATCLTNRRCGLIWCGLAVLQLLMFYGLYRHGIIVVPPVDLPMMAFLKATSNFGIIVLTGLLALLYEVVKNEALGRAQAASRAKSEFLANTSHELRTPLTAILGFSDVLLDDNLPERDRRMAATIIQRNGTHLLSIINHILDLSKIEAGCMAVETVEFDVRDTLADVAGLFRGKAQEKRIRFVLDFAGDLPEHLHSDPTRLRQILINVVGNALKFTEQGEIRITVAHRPEPGPGGTLWIDVADTGIGMTDEQAQQLFEPFTQADMSTARCFGGTGLGLSISRRFARLLGGDLTIVRTAPGCGTTLRLHIQPAAAGPLRPPAQKATPMNMAAGDSRPQRRESETALPYRILVAEDGPDNQRLIHALLSHAGASVTLVENGSDAVAAALACAAQASPYDVILMDMQMPVMSGYEAVQALREAGYSRPIIALTADASSEDRRRCIEAGCNDHISKPIDRNRLTQTIRSTLAAPSAQFACASTA